MVLLKDFLLPTELSMILRCLFHVINHSVREQCHLFSNWSISPLERNLNPKVNNHYNTSVITLTTSIPAVTPDSSDNQGYIYHVSAQCPPKKRPTIIP